jgi:2-phospho-L-lactate guanylyltransferase
VITGLVPVKALAASKSRLAGGDRREIEALSLAMLRDVVEALLRVPELSRVAVVTPDAAVADAARAAGAVALVRDDPGLNPAIEAASAELAPGPGDGVLVVLGDVAAVDPHEISQLVRTAPRPGVALAPSRDGGTSALLRIPRGAIPARFGPDSAKRHRSEAERAGVAYRELCLPSLAIDVDVADDARAILACATLGPRTRAALLRQTQAPR